MAEGKSMPEAAYDVDDVFFFAHEQTRIVRVCSALT